MTSGELMARARSGESDAFRQLTEPYRPELLVHCYRMLGSFQDAEDVLQETLLAAWLALAGFEGRSSLRTWLYRIATNRCLNARRSAGRRQAKEWDVPQVDPPEPTRLGEVVWSHRSRTYFSKPRLSDRKHGTSSASRSRSPSSPPCSCCRRASWLW